MPKSIKDDNIVVCETVNFYITVPKEPHIDLFDGGHIILTAKDSQFKDLDDLPINTAIELIVFSMITGEAMKSILKEKGVNVHIINYQKNGNWSSPNENNSPLHFHLYGRSVNSKSKSLVKLYIYQINIVSFTNQTKDFLIAI